MLIVIETTTGERHLVERYEHHPAAAIAGTWDDLKRGDGLLCSCDDGPYFEIQLSAEDVASVRQTGIARDARSAERLHPE